MELEEFGGGVQVVETSARTGAGLLDLEEALLLQVLRHTYPYACSSPLCCEPSIGTVSGSHSATDCAEDSSLQMRLPAVDQQVAELSTHAGG